MIDVERFPLVEDVFFTSNGIFENLPYDFPQIINNSLLDLQFVTDYGLRRVSPLVVRLLEKPTTDFMPALCDVILINFKHKWDKLIAVLNLNYSALDPFRQYISEISDSTSFSIRDSEDVTSSNNTRTDNLTRKDEKGTSVTDTRTNNLNQLDTRNLITDGTGSTKDKIAGFNSTTSVDEGDTTLSNHSADTGTFSRANTGTQIDQILNSGHDTVTNSGTQKFVESGSKSVSDNDSKADLLNRSIERMGNIGNLSNQVLIKQEIELWKWTFISEVLNDVKELLTLPIYC